MKKVVLGLFLFCGLALLLIACGNDTHQQIVPPTASQFAFIREATGGSTVANATSMHRLRQQTRTTEMRRARKTAMGAGIQKLAADIGNGTDSVILMKNDGTGETIVANQAGWFYGVQVSADAKKGVFSTEDSNGWIQLYFADVSNPTNPVLTQLTNDAENHWYPQLSADNSKIVFVNESGEEAQAGLISTSGGQETVISTPGMFVNGPTWTPDGKIVFEEDYDDKIAVMNADGSNVRVITNIDGVESDEFPNVSADGKTIVFDRNGDVYTVAMDGTNLKQLTTDGSNWDPMFVGDKIIYISYRDSATSYIGGEVYSMNLDGTSQKRLTNNAVDEYFIW